MLGKAEGGPGEEDDGDDSEETVLHGRNATEFVPFYVRLGNRDLGR